MTRGLPPEPDPRARRRFGVVLFVAAGAAIVASIARFSHGYPEPLWTHAVFSALFALMGLEYLLFPKNWALGVSRWVPIALFFTLAAFNLYDALKGL